jgi:hypothetical protein
MKTISDEILQHHKQLSVEKETSNNVCISVFHGKLSNIGCHDGHGSCTTYNLPFLHCYYHDDVLTIRTIKNAKGQITSVMITFGQIATMQCSSFLMQEM